LKHNLQKETMDIGIALIKESKVPFVVVMVFD
jgi:hypothetical protein